MVVQLRKDELEDMLAMAAEKGAARALQIVRKSGIKSAWITKEAALEMLDCSYHTLNRLVNDGIIRKNSEAKRGRKYYSREDIDAYRSGVGSRE